MSLEFNKLVDQVQTMGRWLGQRERAQGDRLERALALYSAATDLDAARARVAQVARSGVRAYRGAAPLDERICDVMPRPAMPPVATVVAADGSQIYPDPHAPVLYYLLNVGLFRCAYGETLAPVPSTEPQLFFTDKDVYDADGHPVSNITVNARRTVFEMKALAAELWALREHPRPLVALHDGGLIKFFGQYDVTGATTVLTEYVEALLRLYDAGATLAGYVDKPRSDHLIGLLHLLRLAPDEANDMTLKNNGDLQGLTDAYLMARVLKPGERSAVFGHTSAQNQKYAEHEPLCAMAFFYLNVSDDVRPCIARVDIPLWVARSAQALDDLHAVILAQCAIQGRRHYPYALTRADELAYVGLGEKHQLDTLIGVELLRHQVGREASDKLQTKGLARGARRQHHLGSK